ncbi:MAG TPA: carboxymuconolactone decarboxylase family protein [Ktedonobacteraceae bacterium]|nr:carboxymuconolactone decarboxylase family protein [Ktedonobacteraceae bacterium]
MPEVAEQFYNLTKSVKGYSPFTEKWNELLLVAIFATHRALRGLGTHIRRAMAEGATKEEILSAILLALPVIGAPDINAALERTLEVIQEQEEEQAELRKL